MAKLVVLPCEDYSKEHVSACVDSIFADFGDAEAFLVKGKNIFIKANLVTDLPPERHGTTHPWRQAPASLSETARAARTHALT